MGERGHIRIDITEPHKRASNRDMQATTLQISLSMRRGCSLRQKIRGQVPHHGEAFGKLQGGDQDGDYEGGYDLGGGIRAQGEATVVGKQGGNSGGRYVMKPWPIHATEESGACMEDPRDFLPFTPKRERRITNKECQGCLPEERSSHLQPEVPSQKVLLLLYVPARERIKKVCKGRFSLAPTAI